MASIGDYIFLAICLAILAGIVYAVKSANVNQGLQQQKDAMKSKGYHLSSDGLHVKTDRVKLSREDEINKAQASWAKSGENMKKHASAFKFNPGTGYEESSSNGKNAVPPSSSKKKA